MPGVSSDVYEIPGWPSAVRTAGQKFEPRFQPLIWASVGPGETCQVVR